MAQHDRKIVDWSIKYQHKQTMFLHIASFTANVICFVNLLMYFGIVDYIANTMDLDQTATREQSDQGS